MARVNIEDRFFGEARRPALARLVAWHENTVTGALVSMWHSSQELGRCEGTRSQIGIWSRLSEDDDLDKWIESLLVCEYISKVDEDTYLIHGNEEQISSRIKRLSSSLKGGEATRKKWEGRRPSNKKATGLQNVGSIQGNAMQGNAMQVNASQEVCPSDKQAKASSALPVSEENVSLPDPKASLPESTPEKLAAIWNSAAEGTPLSKVDLKKFNSKSQRWKHAKARLAEESDLRYWADVALKISKSSFCCGENDRRWKADFGFFIKPETHVKAMEGKYDKDEKNIGYQVTLDDVADQTWMKEAFGG